MEEQPKNAEQVSSYSKEEIKALEDVTPKSVRIGSQQMNNVYLRFKRSEPEWIQVLSERGGLACECRLHHIHDIVQYDKVGA